MSTKLPAFFLIAALTWAAPAAAQTYFDAHNHITGVLPYYAYADLPAFIRGLSGRGSVDAQERLALYLYLSDVWYPRDGAKLGDARFSPPDGQRFSLGARAALVVYRNQVAGSQAVLDGALERVLTATPWSEFDSAYAFRGGPAMQYLLTEYYGGNAARLGADLCKATVLDLAATNIHDSEQSLPFIGGWHFKDGHSDRLDWVNCASDEPSAPSVAAALHRMDEPKPIVKIVFMTHTSQLATLPGGKTYSEWSKRDRCAATTLPAALVTTPATIYHALLAQNRAGRPVVPAARRATFFATVVGIDTAGPETTCFTPTGMQYYERLVDAVYRASKARRALGWHGKLLVHTHVGEGSVIDYAPTPPAMPWTFADAFERLPPTWTNDAQAHANITALLGAIADFEQHHPDVHDYVVFRMAHVAWADAAQAVAMRAEGVEADVNLESNVATGAYSIARMPLGAQAIMTDDVDPWLSDENTNFALNDLLDVLAPDPDDPMAVGAVLGNASLKYLLEQHVRCLLGTDADGVEHSDIVKEYRYAAALIAYWNHTDPKFRKLAGDVSERTMFDNVAWHLRDMSTDAALPYQKEVTP